MHEPSTQREARTVPSGATPSTEATGPQPCAICVRTDARGSHDPLSLYTVRETAPGMRSEDVTLHRTCVGFYLMAFPANSVSIQLAVEADRHA